MFDFELLCPEHESAVFLTSGAVSTILYYISPGPAPFFSNNFHLWYPNISTVQGNAELGQFAFRVTSGEHQCFAALDAGIVFFFEW